MRQEIEDRVIDNHRAVADRIGHLHGQTVGVVDRRVGGRLRGDAVAGQVAKGDRVRHVPVGIILELIGHAALVHQLQQAARIAGGGGGVGIPGLLDGLSQRVGDFGDEAVGVIVTVGVVVAVNDERVAADAVGEGIGESEIIRVR